MRLTGSIALHVLLAVLIGSIHRTPDPAGAPPQIELVDAAIAPSPPVATTPTGAVTTATPSHGGSGTPVQRSARHVPPRPTQRASSTVALGPNGELRIEPVGGGGASVDAASDGSNGSGIGFGNGHDLGDLLAVAPSVPAPPAAPPPPRVSKARPARLIYPSRETQVEDAALFIADVIVDADGFVVGAKLVHGVSGPRDSEAGALIWRFRYDAARDDDGVRTRSVVHQKFAVAR